MVDLTSGDDDDAVAEVVDDLDENKVVGEVNVVRMDPIVCDSDSDSESAQPQVTPQRPPRGRRSPPPAPRAVRGSRRGHSPSLSPPRIFKRARRVAESLAHHVAPARSSPVYEPVPDSPDSHVSVGDNPASPSYIADELDEKHVDDNPCEEKHVDGDDEGLRYHKCLLHNTMFGLEHSCPVCRDSVLVQRVDGNELDVYRIPLDDFDIDWVREWWRDDIPAKYLVGRQELESSWSTSPAVSKTTPADVSQSYTIVPPRLPVVLLTLDGDIYVIPQAEFDEDWLENREVPVIYLRNGQGAEFVEEMVVAFYTM